MSNQSLSQNIPASQIINCILTGIKLDIGAQRERSARTEAAGYLIWITPETVRPSEDGIWIEAFNGYQWSPVLTQTMNCWLRHEGLPEDALAALESEADHAR